MKHSFLLLYLLSLMSGIGVITVAGFFYFKTRITAVKYFIFQHLFITLYVFVDTTGYYISLNDSDFAFWAHLALMLGVLTTAVGLVYFLWLFSNGSIGKDISKTNKGIYFGISLGAIFILFIIMKMLFSSGRISMSEIYNITFSFSTLFSAIGAAFSFHTIVKNREKLEENLKKAFMSSIIVISIFLPAAIILNILEYYINFGFPTAMSPIIYSLINVIDLYYARRYYLGQTAAESVIESSNGSIEGLSTEYGLTEREREIVALVIDGFNNKEIGEKLYISPNTVKNHIYNIYKKLGVSSRLEFINFISNYKAVDEKS